MTPEEKDSKAKAPAKQADSGEAAKKTAAKKPAASKATAKKAPAKKPAAKQADPEKAGKPASSKAKSEAATKTEGAGASAKAPAKKPAAKKPAAKKQPARKAKPKEETAAPTVRARASYVRVAPRKARLIADQVRGMPIDDARTLLRFSPRTAARDIAKLIDSAAANAENNHDLVADDLVITDITVDEGPTLRRYRARALGRATKINKRTSHIKVALTPEE